MRVYLDAAPVIYLIERHATFGPAAAAWLATNATSLVSSELTWMETLVRPVRLADAARVRDFETFFSTRLDTLVPFTRAVFDRATRIRAAYNRFKTPDALHLAAAVDAGCDAFLTNDGQLKQFAGIRVETL